MIQRKLIGGVLFLVTAALTAAAQGAEKEPLKAAAEKSVALLQKTGPEFFRKSGCVACHHQTVTALAVSEARRHGIAIDEKTAREQLQITALTMKSYRTKYQQRIDHPAGSATGTGFILLGMAAEKYPADEYTDDNILDMAGKQSQDGSWSVFGHRPPLEYSRITATALAVRSLQLYGLPGQKAQFERRLAQARDWLIASQPASNGEHAFRLLGLAWAGAEKKLVEEQASTLVKQQRDDGGWAQLPELDSDAYATGLALFALHNAASIKPADTAYQRGVEYLLRTQRADGSWFVKTRAFPFQPYFESGFPYGPDQWISATATGFAAVALMYAIK